MSAPHDHVTDELRVQVQDYLLRQLSPDERRAFDDHVARGCAACASELRAQETLLADLALAAPPKSPRAGLRKELLDRVRATNQSSSSGTQRPASSEPPASATSEEVQIWKRWQSPAGKGRELLKRADEGVFEPTGVAGVSVRRLYVDRERDRAAMVVRMEPGSTYPAHRHGGTEECYVLSGDLRLGDRVMRAGDFEIVQRDAIHGVQSTKEGCLLLIHSSLSDELLDS